MSAPSGLEDSVPPGLEDEAQTLRAKEIELRKQRKQKNIEEQKKLREAAAERRAERWARHDALTKKLQAAARKKEGERQARREANLQRQAEQRAAKEKRLEERRKKQQELKAERDARTKRTVLVHLDRGPLIDSIREQLSQYGEIVKIKAVGGFFLPIKVEFKEESSAQTSLASPVIETTVTLKAKPHIVPSRTLSFEDHWPAVNIESQLLELCTELTGPGSVSAIRRKFKGWNVCFQTDEQMLAALEKLQNGSYAILDKPIEHAQKGIKCIIPSRIMIPKTEVAPSPTMPETDINSSPTKTGRKRRRSRKVDTSPTMPQTKTAGRKRKRKRKRKAQSKKANQQATGQSAPPSQEQQSQAETHPKEQQTQAETHSQEQQTQDETHAQEQPQAAASADVIKLAYVSVESNVLVQDY